MCKPFAKVEPANDGKNACDHKQDIRHSDHTREGAPRHVFVPEESASEPKTRDDQQTNAQESIHKEQKTVLLGNGVCALKINPIFLNIANMSRRTCRLTSANHGEII